MGVFYYDILFEFGINLKVIVCKNWFYYELILWRFFYVLGLRYSYGYCDFLSDIS